MLATADPAPFDHPRLRENIWQVTPGEPFAFVETPGGCFDIPTDQALAFLRIRPHCTPHNNVATIAERSGVPEADVTAMLAALDGIGLIAKSDATDGDIRVRLARIVALWSDELGRDFIANALLDEDLPREILVGWLLETYHYVRDFPEAIGEAATRAPDGPLKHLLERYADEERGHERFVLRTLENLGLSADEVAQSSPLVSTRLIGFLMRDLFETEPASVLLMAALVEAQELDGGLAAGFQAEIEARYALPKAALAPYFEHQAIDAHLGHQQLFADNLALFAVDDPALLDRITDKLHDLKHGFDLQGLEIRHYYGAQAGRYLPRQPMAFAAT